jgi:lysine 2,3-aminomutase
MTDHAVTSELSSQPVSNSFVLDSVAGWEEIDAPTLKPPVDEDELVHLDIERGEFWRRVPGYADVDAMKFLNYAWQMRKSITNTKQLRLVLGDLVTEDFYQDVEAGYAKAPMAMRISPYIISLINWADPVRDPLRIQFLTIGSQLKQDHPKMDLDTLHEKADSPVPGLVHRYHDKALFLPLDTCPVYCRFCTRSYAIGPDSSSVEKYGYGMDYSRWKEAFAYIASRPELEDIVISGGDLYNLRPKQIEAIGYTLLKMPNIKRIRLATKGVAVLPQKILTHTEWLDAVTNVARLGRKLHKDVVIHTHFNHPSEITWITEQACNLLFERGITVRCQSVLQRGVNDNPEIMVNLVKRLSNINVQPYYVYICDMVKGVEDLRTSIHTATLIEKEVRGSTAGFNTPTFVCDAPGGGGKRELHSYEHYNKTTGISVYTAPKVKPGKLFFYFDPLHSLSEAVQKKWADPVAQDQMIAEATQAAMEHMQL